MRKLILLIFVPLIMFTLIIITGCGSAPEPHQETESNPPIETPLEESPAEVEPTDTSEPIPEQTETEIPEIIVEETEPIEETEETFVVTEEIFTKAFEDIESLIKRLNIIIDNEDYDEWLQYLTVEYIDYYGASDTLKELSERPILKKYNIRLTSLNDYFKYVVVPSRADAILDDLVFEDNNHVKAIMIIDDQRVILYQLENVDSNWKIST